VPLGVGRGGGRKEKKGLGPTNGGKTLKKAKKIAWESNKRGQRIMSALPRKNLGIESSTLGSGVEEERIAAVRRSGQRIGVFGPSSSQKE